MKRQDNKETIDKERRILLVNFIKFFSILWLAILFIFGISFFKPSKPKRAEFHYYEIPEEDIPKYGIKKLILKLQSLEKNVIFYLVKTNHSIIAISPACTHLGCFVNFDRESNEFICPCHGGRYDMEGKVISGPPKEPLRRFPLKIEDKRILIGIKE